MVKRESLFLLVQGWLLDCYPSKNSSGMTAWIKTEDGRVLRLKDSRWHAKIYASGQACEENIDYFMMRADVSKFVHSITRVFKRSDFSEIKSRRVLEIELADASKTKKLAELLERAFRNPKAIQLYNVDVMPEQQYFLEKEIFPLAFVEVDADDDDFEVRRWTTLDSASSCEYRTPELKTLRIALEIGDLVPRLDSKLVSISLFSPDDNDGNKKEEREITKIERAPEADIIRELGEKIEAFDPDLIITQNGDAFVLPFLYAKASKFGIDLYSKLNRDHEASPSSNNDVKTGGKTYFSYGRILYRPTTHRLFGRLHLDEENTFVYDQCMLEGLFEVTRLCRMPIHTSMRASIGKCLSGLQFYYAYKENILIPWKPEIPEDFKNGQELFDDDRGGLVLKPLYGVREHIGELDFASLYPSIIKNYNISAETINCSCCGDDSDSPSKFRIEELHMHICDRQRGIVARSLTQPLLKKAWYKKLRDSAKSDGDEDLAKKYNERAASLKWILVCCLAKESPVLIKRNGVVQNMQIGSFIDDLVADKEGIIDCPSDVLVAGVDHDLKLKFCKVKKLLKIPNKQKLLKITLYDGREIVATPNHPFYLLRNESLDIELASDLREGDFIPVARKLPSSSARRIEVIDSVTKPETNESIAISSDKLGQQSIISFTNTRRMFRGDLGFIRIRKLEELDRMDSYVYCFELEDGEVPGFFAGEGAVFTHNCFGYLSYRNAKFGKIDSHIAVCALARKTLVEAMRVSEYNGFRVVHGIVDSLWLEKKNATESDYKELRARIEDETKFKLAFEGIYKWVVFLPSKTYPGKQVANRYFGVFEETGEIKARGIEIRRRDAPLYLKKCQKEILEELAKCDNEQELRICARERCVEIFERYALDLETHRVPPTELLIKRRLSKNPGEYSSARQLSVNAASHLERHGLALKAGQSVSYVITRYKSSGVDRSLPEELVVGDSNLEYDSKRYVELLADACATVLSPLGVTKEELLTRSRSLLNW
jgi:DNA polymerase elongation subunit (family B)